ncbi:hypothetical protein EV421DRAFT_2024366 [Armillaria borealis]|uniref:Uncharacterized protein n=1 Tax=Armillaria borealis TaxID=47425 RepID=A0AA39MFN4_9AGAR|nr:hypothetical protein EV421DRAFT_2024366 [Armillaria borealis]
MPQNMTPQQVANHQSPRQVLCCFITSLLFVFIVPTACIMLAVMLRPGGEISYIRDKFEGLNRTNGTFDWDTCDAGNCTEVDIFFGNYNSEIFTYAQDASTNESVSLVLNSVAGLIIGLKIATEITGKDITYREDLGPGNQVIDVIVTLQRSNLIIVYCLIITFTFWLITLMICLLMITTVVFSFRQRNEIVVVPIGTLFVFTQLRSSMPGALEGFGDILGTDQFIY